MAVDTALGLADRLELLNRFALYAHAYDAGDRDALADLFTDDARFVIHGDVGNVPASMDGRDAIVDGLIGKWEWVKPAQRRHFGTNSCVLEQTERSAVVASYLLLVETRDGIATTLGTGRYRDQWVKEDDGRWRISLRDAYTDGQVP